MKHSILLSAAVLACGLGVARAAPLEAYGKLPTMDMVTISPDGTKIAFVQPVNGKHAVVVDQISPAAVLSELPGTDQKVRSLVWADPTRLLVVKSQASYAGGVVTSRPGEAQGFRNEWFMVRSLDVVSRKTTPLFNQDLDNTSTTKLRGPQIMNTIYGQPEPRLVKGHPVVFARGSTFVDSGGAPALVSTDLETHREAVIESASSSSQDRDWYVDTAGNPYAQVTYDQLSHLFSLRLKRGGAWTDAYSTSVLNDPPEVVGLSPDGSALILAIFTDGDVEFRPVALADGKLGGPITQYNSLSRLITDPVTHRIIGGVTMAMEPDYVFFDPKDQDAWNAVVNSFKDEEVGLVSWSDDRSRIVVRVTGLLHGIAYELVDLKAHKAMELGQAYAGIKPDDLAEVRLVTYPAGDGRPVKAFLTLPNGRDPKGLALVVLPHGGPAARDEAGFDWWAQALASRGYAVLQPQFRGSGGFGWALQSAGFGEFGRKMQTDLSDGVGALASLGMIDPKRVCIVGASYGGYAALAGVTLQQGVYRCAVSVSGLSDVRKFIGGQFVDSEHSLSARYWTRFVGAKDPSDPLFDQIAPAKHADKVSVPVLLIHGKDDVVVPIEQSQKMADALKAANKQVQFVTLPSEDHWLSREETRLLMLQSTVTFLEANDPPG